MNVSVIVPCYNSERYIERCLEALSSQTLPATRYEVIVVDNGSTDRSADLVRGYGAVTLLDASRRGSYAARNVGVRAAKGRILAFTDSDCEVCPTWLEQIDAAMEDPRTAVLLGRRRYARETLLLATFADYEGEKARYVFSGNDASVYYGYTNNIAIRRDVFEQHGPFVEIARGADVVFVSRVLEAYGCDAVKFVPELLIRHLEIDRWFHYHRKMFIYGGSYQGYRRMSRTRALSYRSRLEILRRTVARHRYGIPRTALLVASGVAVTIGYELGKTMARWRTRRR